MRKWHRPSPALVVALVALFVALSGTAVAAGIVPLAKRALTADNAQKLGNKTPAALVQQAVAQASKASPAAPSTVGSLVSVKSGTWALGPRQESDFTVVCDAGQKAIGGGWTDPGNWASSYQSFPTPDGAGWTTHIYVSSYAPVSQSGALYTVCLK